MMTVIAEAFDFLVDIIREQRIDFIRRKFLELEEDGYLTTGKSPTSDGFSFGTYKYEIYNAVRAFTKPVNDKDRYRMNAPRMLDEETLQKGCQREAEEAVAGFIAKLEQKLGEVDNMKVNHVSGGSFNVTAERDGKKILVEQQTIVKLSKYNRLFNQFPARIYVDGKFTSASKYKKLFA